MLRIVIILAIGYILGGFFPNPARWAADWLKAKWAEYHKPDAPPAPPAGPVA